MKRYASIDQIYIEKLAELCGESYAATNSHNLIKCYDLHHGGLGHRWKVIYFALVDYFGRMDVEWKEKVDKEGKNFLLDDDNYFRGQWLIADTPEHKKVLDDCLEKAERNCDNNMTAEEFFFISMDV